MALTSVPATAQTFKEKLSCTPDVIKFCHHLKLQKDDPDIMTQIISCLVSNKQSLRPSCQVALTKRGF